VIKWNEWFRCQRGEDIESNQLRGTIL